MMDKSRISPMSPNSVNEFVTPIFMKKKKHDFKAWRELRKTIKKMDKISPDFDTMHKIWKMLSVFNECYMHTYTDESNHHLFLATIPKGYNPNSTFAMIYREANFSIKFVLQVLNDDKIINIEIDRNTTMRNGTPERISFSDGTYQYKDAVDIEKFMFIVPCLMNGAKELMIHYYKNKKF